jgi:anti-anti-sigma factor
MQLDERAHGDTVVVDLHGSLNRGCDNPTVLLTRIRALANHGYKSIVLNVEELTDVDSMAVGTLAHAYISANRIGAALKILHAMPQLRRLLEVTKLDRVIETVDSEDVGADSAGRPTR